MSRNGSGTYSLPAGNPVVTGTTITSTWANSTLTDIASALTQSVSADGQTPMTGSLNMASNKIISLATPTASTDAVTKAYADALIAGGSTGVFTSVTDSGLTTGRVTYATTGGLLTDSANLTFNGTTLTTANDASISGLTVGKGGGAVASNTAFGASALATNTTGNAGVAIGYGAVGSNTAGVGNVGIGYLAINSGNGGSYNTAVGTQALVSATASYNSAYGYQALFSNTSGTDNNSFGRGSLNVNTTGSYNVAFGSQTLTSNTTASNNTAVGYQAGYSNTTGAQNTFIGMFAGYLNTTGIGNTYVGSRELTNGYSAGNLMTTGSKNTILGNFSGANGSLDIRTASNYIVLSDGDGNPRAFNAPTVWGFGDVSGSNNPTNGVTFTALYAGTSVGIGHLTGTPTGYAYVSFAYNGTAIGNITQAGTTAVLYNTTSDHRLKTDVAPIQNALATVEALNPVSFTWIDGRKDDGFIAHEIQAVIPNCVTGEKDAVNEDGTPKYQQMDNSGVIPFLVKAIQELKAEFDAYKATHP
jgi:hypothetical protein